MEDESSKPEPQGPRLIVEVSPDLENGIYTNLAFIQHTDTELVIDFVFMRAQDGQPKTRVLSRIVTSPLHAKRLAAALADNLAKYEARFGEIKVPETSGLPEGPMN